MLKPNRVSIVLTAAALIILPALLTAPANAQTGRRDQDWNRNGRSNAGEVSTPQIWAIGIAMADPILEKSETSKTGAIGTAMADLILEKSETSKTGAIGIVTTNPIAE